MPPRPDISVGRRNQIMDAALTRFIRKSYAAITLNDIVIPILEPARRQGQRGSDSWSAVTVRPFGRGARYDA